MSQIGLGVMIAALGGRADGNASALEQAVGKSIASVEVVKQGEKGADPGTDELVFTMEDGTQLVITDQGQSCCESRYLTCDDDLTHFAKCFLRGIEVRDAEPVEGEFDVHEQQFLVVSTSKGDFTVCTHNENNGYYGGFYLVAVVRS